MINKILSSILINALVIYVVAKYIPELGLSINYWEQANLEVVFLLWAIFWVFDEIVKRLVKVLIFPLMLLMWGIMTILINIWIFYLFEWTVQYIDIWVEVELWSFMQVVILSITVGLANLVLKKL